MEHQAQRRVPFVISFFESSHYQVDIWFAGNVPGDDFTREQVHYDAKIIPFAIYFDVGKITGPDNVWSFLIEFLPEVSGAVSIIG